MLVDYSFDFEGGNIFAPAANGFFLAAREIEVAILIHISQVAGVEPQIAKRAERRFRHIVVARHHRIGLARAHHNLTSLMVSKQPIPVIHNPHLCIVGRLAATPRPARLGYPGRGYYPLGETECLVYNFEPKPLFKALEVVGGRHYHREPDLVVGVVGIWRRLEKYISHRAEGQEYSSAGPPNLIPERSRAESLIHCDTGAKDQRRQNRAHL